MTTDNTYYLQLAPSTCRILFEALKPIVENDQSAAQLTIRNDIDASPVELILLGDSHDR